MTADGVFDDGAGSVTLTGGALRFLEGIDHWALHTARGLGAEVLEFPATIAASDLNKTDYFGSFPQHASFPVTLAEEGLDDFASSGALSDDGSVALGPLAPTRRVLTPAACYHLYAHFQGRSFDAPRLSTFRCTCFRREETYTPLERQWSFQMREVVMCGTSEAARGFFDGAHALAADLAGALGLPVQWQQATDPFFRPAKNAKALMQQIDPTKFELTFENRLALASVNLHHDHFGRAFDISMGGVVASTACLAFGLERWLAAMAATHGPHPVSWPEVPA